METGLLLRHVAQVEIVLEAILDIRQARRLLRPLHAGGQMPAPKMLGDAGVRQQAQLPVEEKTAVERQPLQPGNVVRVQVGQHDGVYRGGVEIHRGRRRGLSHHLADGMRAVDQQPAAIGLQGQAGRVGDGRKGVSYAQRQ